MKKIMFVLVFMGLGVVLVNAQNTEKMKVTGKPAEAGAPVSKEKSATKDAAKPAAKEAQPKKADKPAEKKK